MRGSKEEHIPYRVAEWLPSDDAHLKRWLDGMIRKTDARSAALHPVTAAGMAAFLNPRVNAQLKRVLNAWAQFLRSSDSAYVLNDDPRKDKGDPIGVFHYGGSTHCLIFRSGVRLEFDHHGQKPGLHAQPIPVNARIAQLVK
jgi:Phophatidylserine decarboxylase